MVVDQFQALLGHFSGFFGAPARHHQPCQQMASEWSDPAAAISVDNAFL